MLTKRIEIFAILLAIARSINKRRITYQPPYLLNVDHSHWAIFMLRRFYDILPT